MVSHDRDFLQGLTETLYEFRDGGVHEFKGDIFEFLEWRRLEDLKSLDAVRPAVATQQRKEEERPRSTKDDYLRSKERERKLRQLRQAVKQCEDEIAILEQQIAEQEKILATGELQGADFYAGYETLKAQLERRMNDWEEAEQRLDAALNV